jgi:putative hemolysin
MLLKPYICSMFEENLTVSNEDEKSVQSNLLDLDQIIENKSPFLKKILPGFILGYLKRTIHQDRLNGFLTKYKDQSGVDFIDGVLDDINTKLDLIGLENIPKKDKCIIASNHPLGGLDGMALMLAVSKVRRDIVFPVNDLLMNVKNLQELFIPINKLGSNAENVRIINETFASDKLICYFPFGLVSRKRNGKIYDLDWKPTFITKAKRFERNIIPTHISGRNTNFFYNLANLRKRLGLKANIEMLYLPDEFIKQENKTLTMHFGKAVPYSFFDKRHSNIEWAELMRQYIYVLGTGNAEPFEVWLEKQ